MKTLNKIVLFASSLFVVTACTELETAPSGGAFTDEQKQAVAAADPSKLAADLNGMYAVIGKIDGTFNQDRADDFGYPAVALSGDLNSGDMVSPNSDFNWFSTCAEYSDRDYTYANPTMRYRVFYNQIKAANDILKSIADDTEVEELLYMKGQALAVRAFDYFGLIQLFQFTYKGNEEAPGVPLVLHTTEESVGRTPVSEIYAQILDDLDQAIELLDGFNRPNKAAVNQNVAYGLRARVNLVMNNWEAAASDAEKAMAGYSFLSREHVSKPSFYSADDSSWIWALVLDLTNITSQFVGWSSNISSLMPGYTAGGGVYKGINSILWDKIPATDVRKGWWLDADCESPLLDGLYWDGFPNSPIAPLVVPDQKLAFEPYINVKFNSDNGLVGSSQGRAGDFPMMRAEEMLLIRAEALAMDGDLSGARSLLENFVKSYRDPGYTCRAASTADMQNEVWFQRRVELWGEGHAFNDLKRLKKNMVRFTADNDSNFPAAFRFNVKADDPWLLLRIPSQEINGNPLIPAELNNQGGRQPQSGDGAGLTDGVLN